MKDLSSIKLDGFKIVSSSYNNVYNFFDVTILKSELTKWLQANTAILHRTSFNGTWGSGEKERVRIWVYDEGYVLKEHNIKSNEWFLAVHRIHEKLGFTSSSVFDILSEKRNILDIGSSGCGTSIEKQSIVFSFHTNKEKANKMLAFAKEIFPKHFLWLESKERGSYEIYITYNEETAKSVGAKLEPIKIIKPKKSPKKKGKKLELTLEEIAKKFNVDVKDLYIK